MCPSRQNNEALEASAPRFLQLSGAPAEPLLERGGEAAGAEGRGDRLWELGEGEPAGCCGAARGKPISQIIGLDPTVLHLSGSPIGGGELGGGGADPITAAPARSPGGGGGGWLGWPGRDGMDRAERE